jgi:hypothetical protein
MGAKQLNTKLSIKSVFKIVKGILNLIKTSFNLSKYNPKREFWILEPQDSEFKKEKEFTMTLF